MTFRLIIRGHLLTQAQLNALVPVMNKDLNGDYASTAEYQAAIEQACADAGHPIPEGEGPHQKDDTNAS